MDQIDIHTDQTVVKTIILGSRILAQGIYKGETPRAQFKSKSGKNYMRGNPFHSAKKMAPNRGAIFYIFKIKLNLRSTSSRSKISITSFGLMSS